MQMNKYQATISRKVLWWTKTDTFDVVARNKTDAQRTAMARAPKHKRALVVVKFVGNVDA